MNAASLVPTRGCTADVLPASGRRGTQRHRKVPCMICGGINVLFPRHATAHAVRSLSSKARAASAAAAHWRPSRTAWPPPRYTANEKYTLP